MTAAMFDTLRYARNLRKAGIPTEQAEAMASALSEEMRDSQVATKADLDRTAAELKADIFRWGALALMAQAGLVAALVKLL